MRESASVEVLSGEVRVLKVGNGQITRSMYRQTQGGVLQLVGRDSKTAALVRYIAQPSNWSKQQGPSEFEHWLQHTRQSAPYPVANGPDGRRLVWTGTPTACPALYGWHVS
jgi:hypothetical protein